MHAKFYKISKQNGYGLLLKEHANQAERSKHT